MTQLDVQQLSAFVDATWEAAILPALCDYIRIPNKSPHFDPNWEKAGFMDRAVGLAETWCRARLPAGASLEVMRLPGRTPLLLIEVPGERDDTVLMYGHLDKQPEMVGWRPGLGPWLPVREQDRLYGRGGADDGYAVFSSLTAINGLREQAIPHARCVLLIETCEESGSYDLPAYIEALAPRLGQPSLVVCLDSGCGNYDQLWCTTSLRGMASFTLRVGVLREGVHSGDASGVVPESFRVLRQLLARLEDTDTGRSLLPRMNATIPADRVREAEAASRALGDAAFSRFPWLPGVSPVNDSPLELLLNRAWRGTLCVTGIEGLPPLQDAGNVLRAQTAAKVSLRLPPTVPHGLVLQQVEERLRQAPPYGAHVSIEHMEGTTGWNAPPVAPWLQRSLSNASLAYFGKPALATGEGGSIPFMGMLGERFPKAQFVITGLLGPGSNAHGPNEFLHIPAGKKLTACIAHILADHAQQAHL